MPVCPAPNPLGPLLIIAKAAAAAAKAAADTIRKEMARRMIIH